MVGVLVILAKIWYSEYTLFVQDSVFRLECSMRLNSGTINQAELELATGLSREVLRKWELRYGFPVPTRGPRGQRLYTVDDLQKLQLVKQLLGPGQRPSTLVQLSMEQLQELRTTQAQAQQAPHPDDTVQKLLDCLAPGSSANAVRDYIRNLVQQEGLAHFVEYWLPAFNRAVGNAWEAGSLGVHAEHRYTEAVQACVQAQLLRYHPSATAQRVLLTTPPGERHALGLLTVHAALVLQGAECFNLGTQTPVYDVLQAVEDWGITLIALSASVVLQPEQARAYVKALRHALPKSCRIWAGGQGFASLSATPIVGVKYFSETHQAVNAWKKLVRSAPPEADSANA